MARRAHGRAHRGLAEVLAFHYGTALEMANSCGLFELEDELAEPTSRYFELAGGRAAPLDATAAAAHFARAQRVADEAPTQAPLSALAAHAPHPAPRAPLWPPLAALVWPPSPLWRSRSSSPQPSSPPGR